MPVHCVQLNGESNKFFSLKEASEMFHLPHAGHDENGCLSNCPPQHSLVGAFTCLTKPLLTILHTHTYQSDSTSCNKQDALYDDMMKLPTVKPFNLAALKVGDLACNIILAPFILAN